MSTRGRGLSADSSDHSMQRCVEDVAAFVESIGEPVALAGPSGGSMFVLGAAALTDAVRAVAACDPLAFELLGEDDGEYLHDAVVRIAELAEEGRMEEAARDWMWEWANEDEMAVLEESGWLKACAENVPVLLRLLEAGDEGDNYSPTDASLLGQITAPVLVLLGSNAGALWPWFTESARYIAEHIPNVSVREIPDAGHCGAWVKPERYAEEIIRFFTEAHSPV
jgi:pimeloyl-ACP methyl ester carboxylesterase